MICRHRFRKSLAVISNRDETHKQGFSIVIYIALRAQLGCVIRSD